MHPTIQQFHELAHRVKVLEEKQSNTDIMSMLTALRVQLVHMENKQMADAASVLAKITANNDRIASQTAALVAISEGQTDIVTEIAALKAQIAAAGVPADFGPLDAAADQQTTLVDGAGKAINANTTNRGEVR